MATTSLLFGTSRRFVGLQDMVAIGGMADVEQSAPRKPA